LNGQSLGAPGGFGGGAFVLAVDRLSAEGRWTVQWNRMLRGELIDVNGMPISNKADVIHALGIERSRNLGRSSLILGSNAVLDLNRDFNADRFSLNLSAGLRATF
jgi:hypothetical protein